MATWHDILTLRDKALFALSGYGKRAGFGQRPAVLVIDVNYNFVGDKSEPILDSVKRFRNSCGAEGWEGVYRIRELLTEARKKHLPTFYTTGHDDRTNAVAFGRWQAKNSRSTEDMTEAWDKGNTIVEEITPQNGDIAAEVVLGEKCEQTVRDEERSNHLAGSRGDARRAVRVARDRPDNGSEHASAVEREPRQHVEDGEHDVDVRQP